MILRNGIVLYYCWISLIGDDSELQVLMILLNGLVVFLSNFLVFGWFLELQFYIIALVLHYLEKFWRCLRTPSLPKKHEEFVNIEWNEPELSKMI